MFFYYIFQSEIFRFSSHILFPFRFFDFVLWWLVLVIEDYYRDFLVFKFFSFFDETTLFRFYDAFKDIWELIFETEFSILLHYLVILTLLIDYLV